MALDTPDRDPDFAMTERERRVYNELERLDLHLAGLFKQGLQYVERVQEPGAVSMLSHAGRELSNAILRLLSGEGDPLTDDEAARVPKGEGNRVKIARALGKKKNSGLFARVVDQGHDQAASLRRV
jgi:hypothetical protein